MNTFAYSLSLCRDHHYQVRNLIPEEKRQDKKQRAELEVDELDIGNFIFKSFTFCENLK
mgnify:CR=1 FL=1